MSRQIYPTLLVTSLVLAVVVCFHPSIPEELLALVGTGLPSMIRSEARAGEPEYTPLPAAPATRYGTVPSTPLEPTSGVRPASWPGPAQVETYGGAAIPVTEGEPRHPSAAAPTYAANSYPSTAESSPQGPVPHAHVPAVPHWERDYSTKGNPYRQWEPTPEDSATAYSSWGREEMASPPPYQQWNPPADSTGAAASEQHASSPTDSAAPPPGTAPYSSSPVAQGPVYGPEYGRAPVSEVPGGITDTQTVYPPPGAPLPPPPAEPGGPASAYAPRPWSPPAASATTRAIDAIPRYADQSRPPEAQAGTADVGRPAEEYRPLAATASPGAYAAPDPRYSPSAGEEAAIPPAHYEHEHTAGVEPFEGAEILARVGSEVILRSELIAMVNAVIEQNRDRIPESQVEQARRTFLRDRLQSAIDGKLVYLDAKRQIPEEAMPGIHAQLTDYFYREHLPMMYKAYGVKNREELEARLEALGSSLARERETTIEQALAQQWMAQQTEVESKVTHEQMLAYYQDHIEEFSFPAKARWQQLMVRISDFPSREAAYAAIGRMGNLLMDGAPFEQVAKEHSKGPTAGEGGHRDWTTRGSLVSRALDQAIFGLPIGALSPVLEDDGALHIVRVTERLDAGREAFVEAQVDIRKKIQQQRKKKALEEYVAKLRGETRITTVFDDDLAQPAALAREQSAQTPYRY